MKILLVNASYKIGSTGTIIANLENLICNQNNQCFILCGYSNEAKDNLYSIESIGDTIWHTRWNLLKSRITGIMGYSHFNSTMKAISWINTIKPDIIHLHNFHGNWINISVLFDFLKNSRIPIVWTLHDCWPFTGRCSHFENINCQKWKTGCGNCRNAKVYPITYFFDFSNKMWKDKKNWFQNVDNLTLVTPSFWLQNYVENSFLSEYSCRVIHNGIDTEIFNCYDNGDHDNIDYRFKICGKKIVLGVASSWTREKGLYDFYELADKLNSSVYKVILVGLNSSQLKQAPANIIAIGRTKDIGLLVSLYGRADVFVNPTYQDTFPTVNLEALSCGTPVVTYRTGGSPESLNDIVGRVVEKGDIGSLVRACRELCALDRDNIRNTCRLHAQSNFNKWDRFKDYIDLYNSLFN